ncbi:YjjW family glycine radical enzyme activase [Clostridiaceae bacterium M8S5]|nr:YjjW family glycine radical enzyme activase [Clostridiaceae bacterium M8S5]
MSKAPVNKMIPFSSVDGPGNRFALFLQGCNFDCLYCHNPETINMCTGCLRCVSQCEYGALKVINRKIVYDKNNCTQCGKCVINCNRNSDPRVRFYSELEIIEEIKKVKDFISGVTVSGGECTLHIEFLTELGKKVRELGLTFYIDTNGSIPLWEQELMNIVDKVMLDIKSFDNNQHIKLTGVDNSVVLKNFKFLLQKNKIYEVRTVIVPDILDNKATVNKVSKILAGHENVRYKLIKYRQMGVRKEKLNSYTPSTRDMNELAEIAKKNGCMNIIIT